MKKKLIFILLPLLLLGGGGAGAWFFFFNKPAVADKAAAEAKKEPEKPAPEAVFVDVGEIIVPVYNRDGKDNFMIARLQLQISDVMPADKVRYMLPRLRDAFIGTLGTMAGRGELGDDSQRNATIKHALQLASDRILGANVVSDVLIQRAWQQPM
jgi:flagellar protein FliL